MLAVLRDCGALAQLLPEVDALFGVPRYCPRRRSVDAGVHHRPRARLVRRRRSSRCPSATAFSRTTRGGRRRAAARRPRRSAAAHSVRLAEAMSARLKVPLECRDAARLAARWHGAVRALPSAAAGAAPRPAALRPTRCAARSGSTRCSMSAHAMRCRRPTPRQAYAPRTYRARSAGGSEERRRGAIARGVAKGNGDAKRRRPGRRGPCAPRDSRRCAHGAARA